MFSQLLLECAGSVLPFVPHSGFQMHLPLKIFMQDCWSVLFYVSFPCPSQLPKSLQSGIYTECLHLSRLVLFDIE